MIEWIWGRDLPVNEDNTRAGIEVVVALSVAGWE